MGGGGYSLKSRSVRSTERGYSTKSASEIFKQRTIHHDMDPKDVKIRESRDSEEHPESLPIIVALDVTGSMGRIPHMFIKDGLPKLVSSLIQDGVKDPQIMFLAVGDHVMDRAPLQVSQFESSDELLDKWLTSVYVEQGGGANDGESYMLAHYFAGYHTVHDAMQKRGQKGFLFTIGDEHSLENLNKREIEEIMGEGQHGDYKTDKLIKKAQDNYQVFHLHVKEGSNGKREEIIDGWKKRLGQNCLVVDDYRQIPHIMAETIVAKLESPTSEVTSASPKEEAKIEEVKPDSMTSIEDVENSATTDFLDGLPIL